MRRFFASMAAMLMLTSLAACSGTPNDLSGLQDDPYEQANRKIHAFNMGADTYVLEPVADAYRNVLPDPAQKAIANHVEWTGMPSTALNSTLQGKWENAGLAVLNFAFNGLTLGLVDIMDEADKPSYEDFGQTLAAADVAPGEYVVLPLLGGTTTRGAAGMVVDFMLNPLSALQAGPAGEVVKTARVPVGTISLRADNYDLINQVKYQSPDSYARTRSIFIQMRSAYLADVIVEEGESTVSDDDFESFFE